jgi:PAS domain-containing protein
VRKDGTMFWANVVITAVKEGDKLLGFLKVTRDLTEKKMAEHQLRVLERGISDIKDYAIFILSPTGIVLSWNAGGQHIKGYTPSEIIGKHFSTFYTQVRLPSFLFSLLLTVESPFTFFSLLLLRSSQQLTFLHSRAILTGTGQIMN